VCRLGILFSTYVLAFLAVSSTDGVGGVVTGDGAVERRLYVRRRQRASPNRGHWSYKSTLKSPQEPLRLS
jgi:hypothetical protein